jgi:hypothetical protein
MTDGDGRPDASPGAARHRILRQLRGELARHPAAEAVRGLPEGGFAELEARVDPTVFGRDADSATLRVVWHPLPDGPETGRSDASDPVTARPRTAFDAVFKLHYSESTGYDCGFHNEPNPHVEGWFHFQERFDPGEEYTYVETSLEARTPTSALWELLDFLQDRLDEEA